MTTEPVIMRDMRPSDVEVLAQIAVAAWEPIYGWFRATMGEELFLTLYPDWRETKAGQIRQACTPGPRAMQVLVAERGGTVVGFVTFRSDAAPGVGELGNNAVRPEFRGQGIAPLMYEAAFARMRAQGMRYARVHTGMDDSHAPARRAYAKVGFETAIPSVDYFRAL